MLKIKHNDEVLITKGKDRGKRGKVTKIFPKINKLIVGGLNLYKRHLKRRSEKEQSQIITLEKSMSISNVALICPHCGAKTKVGFEFHGEKKERFCKKCKKAV